MRDRFEDRPENIGGRKLYNKRFEKYRENVQAVERCFKRYGVRRVQGPPGDDLRRTAVERIVEMQDMMGADRLPISDHFAVIPNYYGTYTPYWEINDDDSDEIVYSKTENLMFFKDKTVQTGLMRYVVALELVIRDFRNYEAAYEPLAKGNLRYLRHPCNSPLPPVVPDGKARVFDVPLGYISSFSYYPSDNSIHMSLVGQYREHIEMVLEVNLDPELPKKVKTPVEEHFIEDI